MYKTNEIQSSIKKLTTQVYNTEDTMDTHNQQGAGAIYRPVGHVKPRRIGPAHPLNND